MAKATLTKQIISEPVEEDRIILELTPEEAQTLADITGRTGGTGRRDHVEDMAVALQGVGFKWRCNEEIAKASGTGKSDISGTIRFHVPMPMIGELGKAREQLAAVTGIGDKHLGVDG